MKIELKVADFGSACGDQMAWRWKFRRSRFDVHDGISCMPASGDYAPRSQGINVISLDVISLEVVI